jgi:hypothetical protein
VVARLAADLAWIAGAADVAGVDVPDRIQSSLTLAVDFIAEPEPEAELEAEAEAELEAEPEAEPEAEADGD